MFKDGYAIGCQLEKCMWWAGNGCAVTKISRQIDFPQINGEDEVEQVTSAAE